jgi:hypothetical protein
MKESNDELARTCSEQILAHSRRARLKREEQADDEVRRSTPVAGPGSVLAEEIVQAPLILPFVSSALGQSTELPGSWQEPVCHARLFWPASRPTGAQVSLEHRYCTVQARPHMICRGRSSTQQQLKPPGPRDPFDVHVQDTNEAALSAG